MENFYLLQKKYKKEDFLERNKERELSAFEEHLKNGVKFKQINFSLPKTGSLYFIYVKTTLRGFHINILNSKKKVLKHITSGKLGYRKAERYNVISLKAVSEEIFSFFKDLKLKPKNIRICIVTNGFNSKRNRFVRSIINSSFKFRKCIISIVDITGLPHNGCRPKKIRRK